MTAARVRHWRRVVMIAAMVVSAVAAAAWWRQTAIDPALTVPVRRGTLIARLTTTGTLRPIQSLTYRSAVIGREVQIVDLVAEGTRVHEGDLLARLDTTELQRDLERAQQDLRQLQLDLQVAHGERLDAEADVKMVAEGDGALTVEEARTRLQLAEKKAERLRREVEQLQPLMTRGFITRDELARTTDQLDQAEEELALARKRAEVVQQLTHPRERQRASLQLAQKNALVEHTVGRVQDAERRVLLLSALIESCEIRAQRPGLVVYEESMQASPRRKIRVGDRVTPSQGLITIPEVSRMLVETTVSESQVHRVHPGQPAAVRLEAFPELRLTGKVARVGTLASASIERALDDKRFALIIELDASAAELRPEMTARADIVVGTRDGVLMIPVNAVFDQQGTLIAHVVGNAGAEVRVVELGESNEEFVEVKAGLREDERVLLSAPPSGPGPPLAPANTSGQAGSGTNAALQSR